METSIFPLCRPRRLRKNKVLRELVGETKVCCENLIMPLFVEEGINEPRPIPSMPGQHRLPVGDVHNFASEVVESGIPAILLFGVPRHKDPLGSQAYNPSGIVQRAVRELNNNFKGELTVTTDICMCQYTDHGHCGIIANQGGDNVLDNDKTLDYLRKIAVSHAEAGADMVAPSSNTDGMVKALREALDEEGFCDISIMSYSAKFASSFYGPFREAASSAPAFGDRRTYQVDPRNAREALRENLMDVEEGADIVMIKPALVYLDIIRLVKEYISVPLGAYNVSGEYAMVKAAARNGWIDEKKAVWEILTSIKRAGADIIITYHALEFAKWLEEGYSPF
ncbi:MAG: porphobilinogen synthase [Candidatus Geothermarchaeales archaeon]